LLQVLDLLTVVGKRIFIDFLSGLEPVSNPRDHTQLENSIFVQLRKRVVELRLGRHQSAGTRSSQVISRGSAAMAPVLNNRLAIRVMTVR
jgi:hypothetical protein